MRAALPGATIEPKLHEGTLDSEDVPWGVVKRLGVLVKLTIIGIELDRECAL